jgi:hypothetical protein
VTRRGVALEVVVQLAIGNLLVVWRATVVGFIQKLRTVRGVKHSEYPG